jgi:tetratricopeptide (TPR) repeat protein
VLQLPAKCQHCGETFPSGIWARELGSIIVVKDRAVGIVANTCPRCGGTGKIVDQSRAFHEDATSILLSASRGKEDLEPLLRVLREMLRTEIAGNEPADRIQRHAPRFTALGLLLPSDAGELYAFLAFLVAVATLIHDFYSVVESKAENARLIRELVRQGIAEAETGAIPGRPSSETSTTSRSFHERLPTSTTTVSHEEEIVAKGNRLKGAKKYQEAVQNYSRALARHRDNVAILMSRGECYYYLSRYENAFQDFDHAIRLDPENALAWQWRGDTHRMLSRWRLALGDYKRSLELDPDNAITLRLRGRAYYDLHRYGLSLGDLTRSLELGSGNAGNAWALKNRGDTYRMMRQYKRALGDLNRSLELVPNDAWALAVRGETYRMMGQYKRALDDLNRSLELEPDKFDALKFRGALYRRLGEYRRALADLNHPLAQQPNSRFARTERDKAASQQGRQ